MAALTLTLAAISIHAPARGATAELMQAKMTHTYFNPRSREGSDRQEITQQDIGDISIHAPARGATAEIERSDGSRIISIHAPARGATSMDTKMGLKLTISIHAPARGATPLQCLCLFVLRISIHAPARGATGTTMNCWRDRKYFNPRSREGSDIFPFLVFLT